MIDIRNFVNVNIERLRMSQENGTRPEVLLFLGDTSIPLPNGISSDVALTYCGMASKEDETYKPIATFVGASSDFKRFYLTESVYVEVDEDKLLGNKTLYDYAKTFFENGGVRLTIVSGKVEGLTKDTIKKVIGQTPIIFAELGFDNEKDNTNESPLAKIAKLLNGKDSEGKTNENAVKGVYQKIFAYREDIVDGDITPATIADDESSPFIVRKISGKVGAEMAICAYLSKISVYENGSIADYDFTEEYGIEEDLAPRIAENGNEDKSLANITYNFEMKVSGRYINIGGNAIDGEDLVEQFVIIILQQTVSVQVMNALTAKLIGQKGTNALYSAVSAELYRYVNSGFLVTDRVWTRPTLSMPNLADTNLTPETVIEKNTPLLSGFAIHVFSLSTDRRSAYIVIILPTAKGIRYVQIDGKAI